MSKGVNKMGICRLGRLWIWDYTLSAFGLGGGWIPDTRHEKGKLQPFEVSK